MGSVFFFVFIWCRFRNYSKKVTWSLLLSSLMINTGFIGYPLILSVFGVQGLIRGVFFDLGSILMFISIGLVLLFVSLFKIASKAALKGKSESFL